MNSEIIIIGGGVIGLALARQLHKKGFRQIKILERGLPGRESSFAAAGMLAPQAELEEINDFFHLCNESNKCYPEFAEELFEETGVDIELDQSGTFYLAFNKKDSAEIRHRFEIQTKAGLPVEHLDATEIRKEEPFVSPDIREGLFFPNDWQVENRKLLKALKKYAELNAVEILAETEVGNILTENGKIAGVGTSRGHFQAETIILATGAWTSLIEMPEGSKPCPNIKPIRGQMMSFHTAKRLFKRVIYSPRGYIVPRKMGKILAGATVEDAGFEKKITDHGIEDVFQNALEIVPSLAGLPVDEKWVGLRPFAADGLPVFGQFSEIKNLYIATAHYRNGILLAPFTATILADKIADDRDSKYLNIFGTKRFQNAEKTFATT